MEGLRLTGLVVLSFLLVKVVWTCPFPFVTGDFSDCEFPLLGCLPGWERVGSSCFKVIDIPLTWPDAQTLCRRDNANLVLVRDTQEAQQAGELINRWALGEGDWDLELLEKSFWIGLRIEGQGYNIEYGNVTYVEGSTLPAISGPWGEGQPDNKGGKYCAVCSATAPHNRAMVSCLDHRYAICERPATQTGDIPCAVDGEVIPRSHVCNGDLNCPDGSDELCDSSCRYLPHVSESPIRFSQELAREEQCDWIFHVRPTYSIRITIEDFQSSDPRKVLDIYCVQDGEDVLAGTVADESGDEVTYLCDSMTAWVRFVHDDTQPRVEDFKIYWEEVPRLSGTVEAGPEAVLYSIPDGIPIIGLSQDPIYNLYFYKLYVGPDDTPITFKFTTIDPNPGQTLMVFNGPSQMYPLLVTLEHGSRYDAIDNVIVTSTGPHVLLIHDTHFINPSGVIEFEYYTGCVVEMEAKVGVILSPGFPAHVRRPPLCTYQLRVPEGKIYMSWSTDTDYPQLTPYDKLDIFLGDSEEPEDSGWNNKYDTEDENGIRLRLVSSQAYASKGFEAIFTIGCEVEVEDDANYQVYPSDREHLPPGEELRLAPDYGYYFNQEELNECSNDREPVTVKCEIGGRWSKQIPPTASPRHCRPPIQPDSAYVYALTGTSVGDEVTYVCYDGYHLVGQHTATCSPDVIWVGVPECPPVSCLPLVDPDHGRIMYEGAYPGDKTFGSVATVVCDLGYEVVGTKHAFCTRYGTWDIKLPLPVCRLVDCGLPPAWPRFVALWPRPDGSRPADFSPQPELGPPPQTTFGSKFWFSCRLGYTPEGGPSREVKCGKEAEWLVGDLECVETVCPKSSIWKVPFAHQSPSDRDVYYYADVVTYLCHPNYQTTTGKLHARLRCRSDGTWDRPVPTCVPASCRVPASPELDVKVTPTGWSHADNSLVPQGTVVTFRCGQEVRSRVCKPDIDNDMFNLIGDSYECGVVDCWKVPPITGLVPHNGFTTMGSTFTFTCLDGILPMGMSGRGDRTVTCLQNGNWDLGNLRCQRNLCPDPGRPADGQQLSTSYAEGAVVTFSCNKEGFTPRPAAIKCLWNSLSSSMVWNVSVSIQSPPICEDKQKPVFPGCPLGPEEVQKYEILPVMVPIAGVYDNHMVQTTDIDRNWNAPIVDDVTIVLRAIDYSNNVGLCNWQIKVRDETPPVISCPAQIVLNIPLDHVGPFRIPDEFDDVDPPFHSGDGEASFEFPDGQQEAPADSRHHTVIMEYSSEDDADNEAICEVPITVVGHTCNWYNYLPERQKPTCYIVGSNEVTCTMQCPQKDNKNIVFYGTDSPIYSLVCEASGDDNEDGAWQEDKEFPDCVEVKKAEVRERPDETSPIVLLVQGLDLEITLGQCVLTDIQQEIGNIAAGILMDARQDDVNTRNCEIAVDTETSKERLPEGTVSISIRFDITRSELASAVDDLEGCKNRLVTYLADNPFSTLDTASCNGVVERSVQGDGMITCELGYVTRPPGQCEQTPLGHFYRNDQAWECPPGTFQDERKAFECKPCPPNTYSDRPASRSMAECRPLCPAGTVGDENHLPPCRRCPPDTYWELNQCSPCVLGSVTNPNVLNIGIGSCKALCPIGSYQPITGYSDTQPCKLCPKGFYQNQVGQKVCTPCLSTQTTPFEGSVSSNLCSGNPADICPECVNGCVIQDNAPRCQCPLGTTGILCDISINACAPIPCHNSGICTLSALDARGYTCGCTAPFAGGNCETDTTVACTAQQCGLQSVGCKDEDNGYSCLCPDYLTNTGTSCGNLVDLCSINPCGIGGGCSTTVGGIYYVCTCSPGYTGPNCETELNECDPSPCSNGGTCVDLVDGWRCACPSNFEGDRCETLSNNLCTPGKCGGPTQGQCEMDHTTGMAFCQCYPGYTEYSSLCFPSPCVGQAMCKLSEDSEEGFECDCPPGRLGDRCETQCRPLEINFLLDVSRAIQPPQYQEQKEFIKALTEGLDPRSGGYRVIQFDNTASTEITASKPEDFGEQLDQLELPTERASRELSSALDRAREEFDDSYTQIIVLPLYGPTGMQLDDLREEWQRIRDNVGTVGKIYPVVLAIGDAVLSQEVDIMATYEDTTIFRIDSMDDAEEAMEDMLLRLCTIHAVNPCDMQPCRNGGTCVHDPRADVEDNYYCRCRQGFTGKDCQIDVLDQCLSPCHVNPCQHGGTCLDSSTCSYGGLKTGLNEDDDYCDKLQNGFYCLCEDSSGVLCDVPHHTCPDDYEECCGPQFPFIGEDCEIGLPRRCSMWHCRHGGTCHIVINLWGHEEVTCTCPPGFIGDRCEDIVDRCEDHNCEHDSDCVSVSNNYYCKCSESTYGGRCELERDLCDFEDKVCLNGGECELSEDGEPTCDCSESEQAAWVGDYCECEMRGPCHPGRPCLHGGTCSDEVCHCLTGYTGTFCQYYVSECELENYDNPPDCRNDGEWDEETCRCNCPCPWGGWDCSKRAVPYFLDVSGSAVIQLIQTFNLPEVFTISIYVLAEFFHPARTVLKLYTKIVTNEILTTADRDLNDLRYYNNETNRTPEAYNDDRELVYTLTTADLIVHGVGAISIRSDVFTDKKLHRFVIVWDPATRGGVTLYVDGVESGFLLITPNIGVPILQKYGYITMGEPALNLALFEGKLAGLLVADGAFSGYDTLPSVVPDYECLLPFYPDLELWGHVTWTELSTACVLPNYCPPKIIGGRPLLPPSLCPRDVYLWNGERVSSPEIRALEPELKILPPDIYPHVKTCSTMRSGDPLLPGKYEVSVGIQDTTTDTSRVCTFNVLIPADGECDLPPAPLHGTPPACFRVSGILTCRLGCIQGFALIRDTSDLVTCHVDGGWRFVDGVVLDARDPVLVPPCGKIRDPEMTVHIGVTYRLDSWVGPWEDAIRNKLLSAVSQINANSRLCNAECEVEVKIENRQPTVRVTVIISRIKYYGEGQVYYEGITHKNYPVEYLAVAIVDNNAFSLDSILTGFDISGVLQLSWKEELSCPRLHQLVRENCVECPAGTYYSEESSRCEFCPIGQYMDQAGQVQCRPCGPGLTTAQVGTPSFQGCISFCLPGQLFNLESRRCEACPKGFYQPYTNYTYCFCCPPTFTSQPGAVTSDSCYEACPPGTFSNSTFYGACRPCPLDTYSSQPGSDECTPCPKHYQTEGAGQASIQSCKDMCYMKPGYCPYNTTCVWYDELEEAICQCNSPSCQPPKGEPPIDPGPTVIALSVGGAFILLLLFCFGIWMCLRRRSRIINEKENCSSVITSSTCEYYPVGMDTIVKRWKPNHPTILTSPSVNVMGHYSSSNCGCGTQSYSTHQHLQTQPTVTQMTYRPQPTTDYTPLAVQVKQEPARMALGTVSAQSTAHTAGYGETGAVTIDYSNNGMTAVTNNAVTNNDFGGTSMSFGAED